MLKVSWLGVVAVGFAVSAVVMMLVGHFRTAEKVCGCVWPLISLDEDRCMDCGGKVPLRRERG